MTHEEAFALMMDALDGVLTPADSDRLDEHLLFCNDCQQEWESLRLVDGLLLSAPVIPAPAGFGVRVQAQLDVPSWRRTVGALFALSIGSLVALLLVMVPTAVITLGVLLAYSRPEQFAEMVIWFNQIAGVSGSFLGVVGTALRLGFLEVAGNPLTLLWGTAAALAVGLWAHLLRRPALVSNGNGI